MAKRKSDFEHIHLLEMLAEGLYAQGLKDIMADIDGYKRPYKIKIDDTEDGDVPDAIATGEKLYIYEVETHDSINDRHTETQWRLFSSYALEHDAIFYVVVSPMEVINAIKRVRELSVNAKVIPMP